MFLHFQCIFPALLLHRHGLFLAFAPVSSIFQGILHDFLRSLSCFPTVSLRFPIHPLRRFSVCFVQHFLTTCFLPFSLLSFMGFCTISSGFFHFFLHFQCIFPRVLPVSFIFGWFLHHFLWLLSHFPARSLYFPTFSSGFCTISSDRYRVFLQFLHPLRGFSVSFCICNLFFQEF